jgi:hypothetical protein
MNTKQIKSVADFKRGLSVGANVHCLYHKEFAGRDEKLKPIYKTIDKGIRKVSIVQSNSFALKTMHKDGTEVDSWCSYPKASESEIKDNAITIYETDIYDVKSAVLTYSILND